MKTVLSIILFIAAIALSGQVPQAFNYQAIVRTNVGNVIPNQLVGVKINIRQGSINGTIVYSERDTATTNQFGLITLAIGQGAVLTGSFASINWATGSYYNEVMLDVTGGTNYVGMGTTQLLSVPYAIYSQTAGEDSALKTLFYLSH